MIFISKAFVVTYEETCYWSQNCNTFFFINGGHNRKGFPLNWENFSETCEWIDYDHKEPIFIKKIISTKKYFVHSSRYYFLYCKVGYFRTIIWTFLFSVDYVFFCRSSEKKWVSKHIVTIGPLAINLHRNLLRENVRKKTVNQKSQKDDFWS